MIAATACRNCGTEPRAGARFCDGCGAPVTRQDVRAEYKQVTVLFADVVHSMDIAAAVGPERLREVMADLVDRCAVVVQRYGGTVDKFTGDGDHGGVRGAGGVGGSRFSCLPSLAHGDAAAYADLRDRYRDMAKTLGFEGHI